jgi:hypothetical protein
MAIGKGNGYMTKEELAKANAQCVKDKTTITLYTGTNPTFASQLTSKFCFDTQINFRDTYVIQKLGSKQQKFKANYGPGIYLTDNLEEARGYGEILVKFVCTQTPYADLTGTLFTTWRKSLGLNGGPQAVLAEPDLAALLLVAAGTTNYYVLRTPAGVEPGNYP